jgi:hypothetical protein
LNIRVQLPPSDAHVATVEDRQRECILQQTGERNFLVTGRGARQTGLTAKLEAKKRDGQNPTS